MKSLLSRKIIVSSLLIVVLISFSAATSHRIQGWTISLISPFVKPFSSRKTDPKDVLIQKYQLENRLLKGEITDLLAFYHNEKELLLNRAEEGAKTADHIHSYMLNLDYLPAKVLFRSIDSWNSTLWINVGDKDNQRTGRVIVAKNSPVVVGHSLVGIVEVVRKNRSRVRLITDPKLTPSVRAFRASHHLAKGTLHGSQLSHWRSRGDVLIGEGFNYDYADDYGPARDLRTGTPIGEDSIEGVPIIMGGDLLITTGMDGVFPEGLHVASVSKIQMLREGDYTYEIEAIPKVKNMNDLDVVYVLPPLDPE